MKTNSIPELPGVYKFINSDNEIIYVGKAVNLKKRVKSYFSSKSHNAKTQELVSNIKNFDIIITKDEYSALILENELIKKYWPKYNIALKDDKSYPFVATNTSHEYPYFDYHVGKKIPGVNYLGPYTDRYAVKSILKEIQKLFLIRSCSDHQFAANKACLLYQIKRCSAPCEGKVSYAQYQKNYKSALGFLSGNHQELLKSWQQEMQNASEKFDFEKAAHYRDLIKRCHKLIGKNNDKSALDIVLLANDHQHSILLWLFIRDGVLSYKKDFKIYNPIEEPDSIVLERLVAQILTDMPNKYGRPDKILVDIPDERWTKLATALGYKGIKKECMNNPNMQKWLHVAQQNLQLSLLKSNISWAEVIFQDQEINSILQLKSPPKHTECFDISHTSGKNVYASCVVFDENGPNKKLYRTYKVPFDDKPDDYKALNFVFEKRYKNLDKKPDLIVVDGGKGQLSTVISALEDNGHNIPVLAISKGPQRKEGAEVLHTKSIKDFKVSTYNQALYSLLFIRNEAHRFALKQHRKSRQKNSIAFKIESVPGISSAKRKALYNHFGGIEGLKAASLKELTNVTGIGKALAEKIIEFFKDN